MADRFDTCILHIGTEKTGTTSLQAFLGANREMLRRRGFFVPQSLSPYKILANHERLTTYALGTNKVNDDVRRAAGLLTAADIPPHRQRVLDDLRAEISRLATAPSSLVLSNEHCHSRLTSEEEIATLADMLSEFANAVQVVVYLRPQHELAISLYDQALKAGYADIDVLPSFHGPGPRWVERGYFDYEALTTRWSSVFGKANVAPRIFSRSRLIRGNIIDDFLSHMPCDDASLVRAADSNTSISARLQPALNALNRYAKAHPDSMSGNMRPRVITLLQKLSAGPGRHPSRAAARAFYQQFEPSNERVRQSYFPNQPSLFDLAFEKYPETPTAQPPESDALAELLVSALKPAA